MSSKTNLLSTIALLVIALAVAIFFIFRDNNSKKTILTAEQLSRFEEGMLYRTIVTSTVQGQVEDRDCGIGKKITLIHEGETDFIREVKSVAKDHTEVVVDLEILTARDLEVTLALDDVNFHLPPAVGVLGRGARKILLPGPEGVAIDIATDRAAEWLRSDVNRQKVLSRINFAVEGVTGKGLEEHLLEAKLQPLEAYEGLTAEYTYEAGKGLVDFQTKATLSKEKEDRVKNFSVYSEAYLLPDTDRNVGE